jgi:hypothetical protein
MSCVSSMRESRIVQSARLGLAAEHPDPYRAAAPTFFAGRRAEAL